MAAKVTEEECNLTTTNELIRIGQCRFTVSDLGRMEKIIAEKLSFKSKAITALTFLHLYHQIALSHCTDRWDKHEVFFFSSSQTRYVSFRMYYRQKITNFASTFLKHPDEIFCCNGFVGKLLCNLSISGILTYVFHLHNTPPKSGTRLIVIKA